MARDSVGLISNSLYPLNTNQSSTNNWKRRVKRILLSTVLILGLTFGGSNHAASNPPKDSPGGCSNARHHDDGDVRHDGKRKRHHGCGHNKKPKCRQHDRCNDPEEPDESEEPDEPEEHETPEGPEEPEVPQVPEAPPELIPPLVIERPAPPATPVVSDSVTFTG